MVLVTTACADHSDDPKTCRERVAKYITTIYENPDDLEKAMVIVCPPGAP